MGEFRFERGSSRWCYNTLRACRPNQSSVTLAGSVRSENKRMPEERKIRLVLLFTEKQTARAKRHFGFVCLPLTPAASAVLLLCSARTWRQNQPTD